MGCIIADLQLNTTNTTVEQRMLANGAFGTLNEASAPADKTEDKLTSRWQAFQNA